LTQKSNQKSQGSIKKAKNLNACLKWNSSSYWIYPRCSATYRHCAMPGLGNINFIS